MQFTLSASVVESSVVVAAATSPSSTTVHSTSPAAPSLSTLITVFLPFSNVNSEEPVFEQRSIEFEGLAKGFPVVEFDVAKALELVSFAIPDEANTSNLKMLDLIG